MGQVAKEPLIWLQCVHHIHARMDYLSKLPPQTGAQLSKNQEGRGGDMVLFLVIKTVCAFFFVLIAQIGITIGLWQLARPLAESQMGRDDFFV